MRYRHVSVHLSLLATLSKLRIKFEDSYAVFDIHAISGSTELRKQECRKLQLPSTAGHLCRPCKGLATVNLRLATA